MRTTALPVRVLNAQSAPVNVFRNKERYCLDSFATSSSVGPNAIRADAWKGGALYAKDRLLEDHIPSYLLHDHLVHAHLFHQTQCFPVDTPDIALPYFRRSTLTSCHHEHRSLLVHAAGRYMDELIVRDTSFMRHQMVTSSSGISNDHLIQKEGGFTLPLSRGTPVVEVMTTGVTACHSCASLLARTHSEVFYLRTVNIDDHIPIHYQGSEGGFSQHSQQGFLNQPGIEIMLEPLQKWQLPTEIASMSSSITAWSYAAILGTNGKLFTWNPVGGLIQHSDEEMYAPSRLATPLHGRGTMESGQINVGLVSCTLHPQVLLMSFGTRLRLYDLRTRYTTTSSSSSSSMHHSPSPITSIAPHPLDPHLLVVCDVRGSVSLMDQKYMNTHISQKTVPEPHNRLSCVLLNSTAGGGGGGYDSSSGSGSGNSSSSGSSSEGFGLQSGEGEGGVCYVGGHVNSRQLYLHHMNTSLPMATDRRYPSLDAINIHPLLLIIHCYSLTVILLD